MSELNLQVTTLSGEPLSYNYDTIEIIKMNYNNSMFYEDDSLLSAYSITKSLTVTNGVYDMGY